MRAKLIAANWKMNGSFALIDAMQKVLSPLLEETTCEIVICPPDVLLSSLNNTVKGSRIVVGAQNVHSETSGAFTGETSAPLLQECGVQWCIVGHSERRILFGETDDFIRSKTETLLHAQDNPERVGITCQFGSCRKYANPLRWKCKLGKCKNFTFSV